LIDEVVELTNVREEDERLICGVMKVRILEEFRVYVRLWSSQGGRSKQVSRKICPSSFSRGSTALLACGCGDETYTSQIGTNIE